MILTYFVYNAADVNITYCPGMVQEAFAAGIVTMLILHAPGIPE